MGLSSQSSTPKLRSNTRNSFNNRDRNNSYKNLLNKNFDNERTNRNSMNDVNKKDKNKDKLIKSLFKKKHCSDEETSK